MLRSSATIDPCYQDVVSYAVQHDSPSNKPILIDADDASRFVTLEDARQTIRTLIGAMRDRGIGPDRTVCMHMFNSIYFPLVFLAIVGTGARATASNPAYTAAELQHHFSISSTSLVITTPDNLPTVRRAAKSTKNVDLPINAVLLDDLLNSQPQSDTDWLTFDNMEAAQTTIACLNTTSGTTGLPKMAARSHHSMVTENLAIEDNVEKPYEVRRLLCTPFFHAFTLPLAVISALRHGHTTYVMRRFDQAKFLDVVGKFKITETAMPPPMLVRYLAMTPASRDELKRLRLVWSGGAALAAETQSRAIRMFAKDARICQVWGMTEGGWFSTFAFPEKDNSGSVGRLIATYEAIFVPIPDSIKNDSKGLPLGEIFVRGPINMLGYFGNKAATVSTITIDGWLRTGDVGYATPDGRIFIVDRVKELIKVRGWQVAPAEIEARLLSHPGIADAAAIGIARPDEATEIPRAYVVLHEASGLRDKDVKQYLLQSLAKYKVGDCQVRFVDSIPKSASGKILRKLLREQAANEGKSVVGAEP